MRNNGDTSKTEGGRGNRASSGRDVFSVREARTAEGEDQGRKRGRRVTKEPQVVIGMRNWVDGQVQHVQSSPFPQLMAWSLRPWQCHHNQLPRTRLC